MPMQQLIRNAIATNERTISLIAVTFAKAIRVASIINRERIEAWVAYPNKAPFVAQRCKPFGVRHPNFASAKNAQN
jgi:hypothetical protein